MKICSSCHSLIEDDAVTCPNCGAAQRHFPANTAQKRKKSPHPALKLILPSVLVVALMGVVLAFALRKSGENTQTTTTETTAEPINAEPIHNASGSFSTADGHGYYIYYSGSRVLYLDGTGVLSANAVGETGRWWQHYLEEARVIEVNGFSEIEAETFRGMRALEKICLISFKDDVLLVGDYAFADCPKLSVIEIVPVEFANSSQVRTVQLGDGCFSGCTALTEFNAAGTSGIGEKVFEGVPKLDLFFVSEQLQYIDSLPMTDDLQISIKSDTAIRRSVWDKLLQIDPDPLVWVDGEPLTDLSLCPIAEDSQK